MTELLDHRADPQEVGAEVVPPVGDATVVVSPLIAPQQDQVGAIGDLDLPAPPTPGR